MDAVAFTDFLHSRIPLARAMALRVLVCEPERICIAAPLEPNLNLHGTAFGGSLAALGILTGWAQLHSGLLEAGIEAPLVVRHSELDYLKPATGTLLAESRRPDAALWTSFLASLRRGRRAAIESSCTVRSADVDVLRVTGRYVALPARGEPQD